MSEIKFNDALNLPRLFQEVDMEIKGYKYLAHKIVPRPWGIECRFAVARLTDDSHINDIAMLETGKEDEKEIALAVAKRLSLIDVPVEYKEPERIYTEAEIKSLLVEKGYLKEEEKVEDLKALSELTKGVKP